MKHQIILIAVALFSLTATSCIRKVSEIYGDPVTQTISVGKFNSVNVQGGNIALYYTQGKAVSAKITGPEQLLHGISLRVEQGVLTISDRTTNRTGTMGLTGDNDRWIPISKHNSKNTTVHVYLTSPTLRKVTLAGAADFESKQSITTDSLDIEVAGAGDVDFTDIQAQLVKATVAGAGDLKFRNLVDADFDVSLAGAGDLDFTATRSRKVNLRLSGVGDIDGKLQDCGDVSITLGGAGDVELEGTARTLTKHVGGVGDVDVDKLVLKR